MANSEDEKLNQLLKEAYPAVEVSPDFTLRLWRRLMKSPSRPSWMPPVPVMEVAAALGILAGLFVWTRGFLPGSTAPISDLRQTARLDLFGNAPLDTVAGSFLELMKGERS
ncbi:MAG: hypothetical protein HYZ90_06590 [Candidatus Omnitrophica bacterium]|nr:hypothetical protein [Candidatus Omnitrophota bacterium]